MRHKSLPNGWIIQESTLDPTKKGLQAIQSENGRERNVSSIEVQICR